MNVLLTPIQQASSSRRENSSDYSHRHSSHGNAHDSRNSSSHRRSSNNRHASPSPQSRNRSHEKDGRGSERMGPPNRVPQKKFRSTAVKVNNNNSGGNYRTARDSGSARNAAMRNSRIGQSARSAIRRKMLLRQRDSARRVKLARMRRYCICTSLTIS